jgi:hypothetical protein
MVQVGVAGFNSDRLVLLLGRERDLVTPKFNAIRRELSLNCPAPASLTVSIPASVAASLAKALHPDRRRHRALSNFRGEWLHLETTYRR